MKQKINTVNAPTPIGPYSQAIKAGKSLFISGQLPINPTNGKVVAAEIKTQTIRVLENIKAILENANYTLAEVIQTTVYLSSLTLFKDFNTIYARYFDQDYPARATIGAELMPGILVEISAIAYKE